MRSSPTTGSAVTADRAALRLAQLATALGGSVAGPAPSAHSGGPETPPEWWSDHTRIAEPPEVVPPAPRPIPEPGRHAQRRRGRAVAGLVRERLPPVGDLGAAHLAVLALVAALAIAATAWWLLRDRGPIQPLPAAASSAAPLIGSSASPVAETGPSASGSPSATASKVTVDVVGKVRHPGIAVLDSGARVVDAIKAAGGALRGVDLSSLNLARVLVDGEQIAVGVSGAGPPVGGSAGGSAGAPGTVAGAQVNLNTATVDQLETLPDVGPVTAQSILTWREQNGGFTSVDQLLDVDGIGDATLAKLTPYVTV